MGKPTIAKDDKTAMLIGYEGYVGQHLTDLLMVHPAYERVIVIGQKKQKKMSAKVQWLHAEIRDLAFEEKGVNDLFICYDASFFNAGGKYAIPKENYRYFPRLVLDAYRHGVSQVMLLSARSAKPDALLFSQRIRGLIEESVRKMGFWSTHIFRPSILIGESSSENWGQQVANQIGSQIDRYTGGWLRRVKPIEAQIVAQAMLEKAQSTESGTFQYSSEWLQDYAITLGNTSISKAK